VVPTIREDNLSRFLELWSTEFSEHRVIVVEDNPEPSFSTPAWVEHYSWKEIDEALGAESWIIPRRSDCVRSFGYLIAARQGVDFVITLDDDCYPESFYPQGYVGAMCAALNATWPDGRWWSTLSDDIYPRGYPYEIRDARRETYIHHGLWSNIPDLDARTQTRYPNYRTKPATKVDRVPVGQFFPMCGMNLAFRREIVDVMYFLLMGHNRDGSAWPFDRFGDIWAGLFAKRVSDHLGLAVSSGAPSVHHSRASHTNTNLRKETPGYPVNEQLWKIVSEVQLTGSTPKDCYIQLARGLPLADEYWMKARTAMEIWATLCP
jgi:reversibly glycosylated polypeptide/UDP-arabinopyranose mutase